MTEEQHFNIDLTVAVHEQDQTLTEREARNKIRDSLDCFDDLKVLMAQRCEELDK